MKAAPSGARLGGLLLALGHAVALGTIVQREFQAYFSGSVPDLSFHGFAFAVLDFPVTLLVIIFRELLGFGLVEQDIWSYAVMDTVFLSVGTAYWFAVGYAFVWVVARRRLVSGDAFKRLWYALWPRKAIVLTSLLLVSAWLLSWVLSLELVATRLFGFAIAVGSPLILLIAGVQKLIDLAYRKA